MSHIEHVVVDITLNEKRFLHTRSLPESGGGFGKETFTIDGKKVDEQEWRRQFVEAERAETE